MCAGYIIQMYVSLSDEKAVSCCIFTISFRLSQGEIQLRLRASAIRKATRNQRRASRALRGSDASFWPWDRLRWNRSQMKGCRRARGWNRGCVLAIHWLSRRRCVGRFSWGVARGFAARLHQSGLRWRRTCARLFGHRRMRQFRWECSSRSQLVLEEAIEGNRAKCAFNTLDWIGSIDIKRAYLR